MAEKCWLRRSVPCLSEMGGEHLLLQEAARGRRPLLQCSVLQGLRLHPFSWQQMWGRKLHLTPLLQGHKLSHIVSARAGESSCAHGQFLASVALQELLSLCNVISV